jgi:sulfatase maturation enzyme AslB (radical SAM superfamily)
MFEKVVSEIVRFKDAHPEYQFDISLLGGEPLLVADRSIEFFKRLQDNRTELSITTNFNFKPNGTKIKKLQKYFEEAPFIITCSVHESSNLDWLKENIKTFKRAAVDYVDVSLLVNHDNVDLMQSFADWLIDLYGPMSYTMADIRNPNKESTVDFSDPKMQRLLQSSNTTEREVTIGDVTYSAAEAIERDFKNISSQYYTVCKINSLNIGYDGRMRTACGYPYTQPIEKGLEVLEVFCNKYTCYCNTISYKKLIRSR